MQSFNDTEFYMASKKNPNELINVKTNVVAGVSMAVVNEIKAEAEALLDSMHEKKQKLERENKAMKKLLKENGIEFIDENDKDALLAKQKREIAKLKKELEKAKKDKE